ncbi:MAG: addiction module antitoxin [Planctomycetota bacterium]|nr:addiction module antitoxin [Planctomycetota bacterium]
MTRKLTISIDDRVYDGLLAVIGRGNIGRFLEGLARPFVVTEALANAYTELSADEDREAEANQWSDAFIDDGLDETR